MTGIAVRHPGERVVIVTHGGFLKGFFEHVLGIEHGDGWRFHRHNASLSIFQHEGRGWSLESWNDTGHLEGVGYLSDPALQLSNRPE